MSASACTRSMPGWLCQGDEGPAASQIPWIFGPPIQKLLAPPLFSWVALFPVGFLLPLFSKQYLLGISGTEFYGPDPLLVTQWTVSKHWRKQHKLPHFVSPPRRCRFVAAISALLSANLSKVLRFPSLTLNDQMVLDSQIAPLTPNLNL